MSSSYDIKGQTEVEMVEKSSDVTNVKTVKGSEAFAEAMLKEPPNVFHPTSLLLIACTLLGFFCQTMNGFDGSLFGGLTANNYFLDHFHGLYFVLLSQMMPC